MLSIGAHDYESEEWIDLVDRGGLIHVDDSLYSMFLAMEVGTWEMPVKVIALSRQQLMES